MFEIFKKPHPFIFNVYSIVIPCTITFLVVVIFAPFHFRLMETSTRIGAGFIVSFVVGVSIISSVRLLKRFFPGIISADKWTVGKELLLIMGVVAVIFLFITIGLLVLQTNQVPMGLLVLKTAFITLALSSLPILVSILFEQYWHQKRQLRKAMLLNQSLKDRNNKLVSTLSANRSIDHPILIKNEKGRVELKLTPADLVYVKSDGNYVEVFYINDGQLQKKLVRNRLKNIEAVLPRLPFFKCHNSYVVNGLHILKVEGNARNLMLNMKNVPESLPVSRSKARALSLFLEDMA